VVTLQQAITSATQHPMLCILLRQSHKAMCMLVAESLVHVLLVLLVPVRNIAVVELDGLVERDDLGWCGTRTTALCGFSAVGMNRWLTHVFLLMMVCQHIILVHHVSIVLERNKAVIVMLHELLCISTEEIARDE
jgi:hypothetical protein